MGMWESIVFAFINFTPSQRYVCDASAKRRRKKKPKNNVSGVVGVSFDSHSEKWIASGMINGIKSKLYYGNSLEKAIEARREWERLWKDEEDDDQS